MTSLQPVATASLPTTTQRAATVYSRDCPAAEAGVCRQPDISGLWPGSVMARLSGKAAKANWRAAVGPDNSSEYLEINASQAPLPGGASEVPQRRLAVSSTAFIWRLNGERSC